MLDTLQHFLLGFLIGYVLIVFCWILYIAIMRLKDYRHDLHWFAKFNAYWLILPVGLALDACLNLLVCLIFWRRPKDWLLTGTLKRTLNVEYNWRADVAAWICTHLLNQFDSSGRHC